MIFQDNSHTEKKYPVKWFFPISSNFLRIIKAGAHIQSPSLFTSHFNGIKGILTGLFGNHEYCPLYWCMKETCSEQADSTDLFPNLIKWAVFSHLCVRILKLLQRSWNPPVNSRFLFLRVCLSFLGSSGPFIILNAKETEISVHITSRTRHSPHLLSTHLN